MEVLETLPWREVGKMLYVPDSKLDTMDADHTTNKGKKEAVIEYWILKDPSASWRRLIYTLDKLDKIDIADQIRKYAEKQTGQYNCHSTEQNLNNGVVLLNPSVILYILLYFMIGVGMPMYLSCLGHV